MKYYIKEEMPGLWFVDLKVNGEKEYIGAYIVASGKEVALVEVGPSSTAENLLSALDEIGFYPENVKYLLLTHVHLDHGGATGKLIKYFPNAYVVVHKRGVPHLIDPEAVLWKASKGVLDFVAEIYGKPESVPREKIIPIEGKKSFTLQKLIFEIIPTPGHASHHVSIFLRSQEILFTGDSSGVYVPSLDVLLPNTPPPFRLDLALKSLETMISLEPRLNAYTHFDVSPHAKQHLKKHYGQLLGWYENIKEIIAQGIQKEEEILDLLSERDSDLKRFLLNSQKLNGLRRGVEMSLRGFIQLVFEEKKRT